MQIRKKKHSDCMPSHTLRTYVYVCRHAHHCACFRSMLVILAPLTELFRAAKLENQLCATLRAPAHTQGFAHTERKSFFTHYCLWLHDVRGRKSPGILVGFKQPAWLTNARNTAVLNTEMLMQNGSEHFPPRLFALFFKMREAVLQLMIVPKNN